MQYTQAQIDRANAVSLEDFLRTQGETLIKSGREYRWKEHDSLTVRGNKWFRHSQSKGGYPIDFVMEFYGKSFPEAVQMLTGENGEGQTEATTAPPTAFHLPLHNRTADRAIQYLCESRGLNKTLVEAFLLSGDIYEDAKRHNVVFVGRDRSGTPRYAHVRGTADTFRQDITGSDKSYPFRYEGNGNQLFVFEAPIDLLSFICLYPQDWQTRSYLALGGVSGKALDRFLAERKDTRKVFLCLDSDTAVSCIRNLLCGVTDKGYLDNIPIFYPIQRKVAIHIGHCPVGGSFYNNRRAGNRSQSIFDGSRYFCILLRNVSVWITCT